MQIHKKLIMMHEVVYLNEENITPSKFETHSDIDNMWYLDNGGSNHMTENRAYFSKIDERVTRKIRFGDDSCMYIKGKGSILFICKDVQRNISGINCSSTPVRKKNSQILLPEAARIRK